MYGKRVEKIEIFWKWVDVILGTNSNDVVPHIIRGKRVSTRGPSKASVGSVVGSVGRERELGLAKGTQGVQRG